MYFVPVFNMNNKPLMPTTQFRAKRWIISGKATPFWKNYIFCVRLNVKTEENRQSIAIGIDPGSKKEGFTVKSKSHTYLNVQTDAIQYVKDAIKTRKIMRRFRRRRKTPCRKPRWNRGCLRKNKIAPSTKARWAWKLTILRWLMKMFPCNNVVVEDIKAKSMGKKKWDSLFSPLEVGKKWFYNQIPNLILKQGWETKQLRDELGLKKSKNKLSNDFSAHCIDSWALANSIVGGNEIDNREVICIARIRLHRRQLHQLQPHNGVRKREGGTISLGLKKGSLVRHGEFGITYVGGTMKNRISLHNIYGQRITQCAKIDDCKLLTYNKFKLIA